MGDHLQFLATSGNKKDSVQDAAAHAEWTAQKWIWVASEDKAVCFSRANILTDKGDDVEVKIHDT
eukprot:Pgem_evm1s9342